MSVEETTEDSKKLICDSVEDGQESAWLEPGSVLRRVEPHVHGSSLEHSLKSPPLNRVAGLCEAMDVHPLTLLTLAYADGNPAGTDQLLARIRKELEAIAGAAE